MAIGVWLVQACNGKPGIWVVLYCILQFAVTSSSANAWSNPRSCVADGGVGSICLGTTNVTHARMFNVWVAAAQVDATESNATDIEDDPRVKRWRLTLMYGALLLLIFITAAVAIIVFSRRWRQWIRGGRKTGPTDATDVWAMHREPEGDENDVLE